MRLNRTNRFLPEQDEDVHKAQAPSTDEGSVGDAMSVPELNVAEELSSGLYDDRRNLMDGMYEFHPKGTSIMSILWTYNSSSSTYNFLNLMAVLPALPAHDAWVALD